LDQVKDFITGGRAECLEHEKQAASAQRSSH
jgi:hypothetical protein